MNTLLRPCRALDLADDKGILCGKILADLGADVVKIEKPGGDPARKIGPFYHNIPDSDKSLFWFAYNSNKRGITLDIETATGGEMFVRLVRTADFVIESFAPGYMDGLGLGYEALSTINPRIVMASITPFGQTGPYRDYKANDLVCWAMGGMMYMTGDYERAPVQVSFPQSYVNGGAQAAAAMLIAHFWRETTGLGQYIDVSIREAIVFHLQQVQQYWDIAKMVLTRSGCYRTGHTRGAVMRLIWPCRDGYVSLTMMGGPLAKLTLVPLVKWMNEEGATDDFLRSFDWNNYDSATATQGFFDQIEKPVARFLKRYTRAELFEQAAKRSIILYPVNTAEDVLADRQIAARSFWTAVDHPELNARITYPGAFFKSTEVNGNIRHRAPLVGEHNHEVLGAELRTPSSGPLGLEKANAVEHGSQGEQPDNASVDDRAFAGIRVADFTWAAAGPLTTRYLSDHGAEVIKIESAVKVDSSRTATPYRDNMPGLNRSGYFARINRGKFSLGLNLSDPRGIELAKRIIAKSDIVIENFTPGTMERWGLSYSDLRRIKADIIMVRTSQLGQTGPLATHPGLGTSLVALAGLTHITGWPDHVPTGPFGAYPDHTAPPLATALIAAALDYRRRTGRGQQIDLSQYEASLLFLTPVLLDCSVNGTVHSRTGNRVDCAAPHGAYPCSGNDRWCAIAVSSDEEWFAFCRVLGDPAWSNEPGFATPSGRKQNEAELERLVGEWTKGRTAEEVMRLMQAEGVPAGVVQTAEDLQNDPQLEHRGHQWTLDHPEIGIHTSDAPPFLLSRTPARPERPAPCLGEHNELICRRLLGMSDDEFAGLLTARVLHTS